MAKKNSTPDYYQLISKYQSYEKSIDIEKKILDQILSEINLKADIDDIDLRTRVYEFLFQIYKNNNLDSDFEELIEIYIPFLQESKNPNQLGRVYYNLNIYYRINGKYDLSLEYIQKALEVNKIVGSSDKIGLILNSIGNHYLETGEYNLALENYYKAFEYIKNEYDTKNYHIVKHNLAKIYLLLNYYSKAKELFVQDLDKLREDNNIERYAASLQGIAEVYSEEKRYKLAYKYTKQSKELWDKTDNHIGKAIVLNTLGSVYNSFEKYEEALNCFAEAKQIFDKMEYKHGLVSLNFLIGETNLLMNNLDLAIEHLDLARRLALEIKQNFELRKIYGVLYKAYEQKGQEHNAYIALKELTILNDTIFNFSLQAKVNEVQVNFELERKELEYNKEREINEYKNNLFSYLTHEFRTPLTLINTPIELMKNEENIHIIRSKMSSVSTHVQHMQHLLNQLLDINKIEEGKMPIMKKAGSINPLLWHLIHLFEPELHDKDIQFTYNLPKKNHQGFFDNDKIEKIISNLLSNALKYSVTGGSIQFTAEFDDDNLILIVKDDGIGIEEQYQKDIFNKFYRIPSEKDVKGSGLGLSFVKELVTLLGGTIDLESAANEGSTFLVKIPFEKIERPKNTEKADLDPDHIDDNVIKRNTVLIVEDNIEILKLLKEVFNEKYKVMTAEHGREAVSKLKKNIPDIIVSDIMMPLMNGIELCEFVKINEDLNHIPIILLSAKSQVNDKLEGLESGADAYITKPFNITELTQTVENLLSQRKKIMERFSGNVLKFNTEELVSSDRVFIQHAQDFVLENIEKEELSVNDLAKHLNMSRFTLIRKFKKVTDSTPNTFIQKIRLEKAKELIKNKVANVTEIAFKVGFSSTTYFSFSFKKEYGMTPKEFYLQSED